MAEYIPSDVFEDEEEGGGPFGRSISVTRSKEKGEPKLIESPVFGQDAVDLKRCPHGKVVCRLCPHDGRPYIVEPIPEWPEKFSREEFEERLSAKDALFEAEYRGSFPPQTPCSQCGEGMNPAEVMLGPVCGKCCRKNHRSATRR